MEVIMPPGSTGRRLPRRRRVRAGVTTTAVAVDRAVRTMLQGGGRRNGVGWDGVGWDGVRDGVSWEGLVT